ncbi:MAG: S8 family peptidase, partial [Ferruginibacter sp.]
TRDSISVQTLPLITSRPENINDYYNYGSSNGQVKIHHGDFLHNHGFRGEGMQLTMLDAGFYHYKTLPTFDSIRVNQILGTWDFVANEESVDEDNSHGMHCLSTIAANLPGSFVGTAPKTSFYLFRTEDVGSEYPIEEQNLAAGAERADSLGVDVCSISLGYFSFDASQFDYSYSDMNGNTSISARAADLAAKKGMLMVIAAGNEGNSTWHYIITPADADSVLSVGAVDTTGVPGSFSSYGPSSDGQVKPAVASVGVFAVVANTGDGQPSYGFGTSYACPNMAGITTCLWQAFPEISNMGIIDALQLSANKVNNPDDRIGYGIPDAKKAFVILQKRLYTRSNGVLDCKPYIQFSIKTDNTMSIEVERKLLSELAYTSVTTLQNNGSYGSHDFHFDDDLSSLAPGMYTYRLKMIISSDTTFYLDSLSVDHLASCNTTTANSIIIAPNPVIDNDLTVKVTRITPAKINIVLLNALGQRIYSKEYQQLPGVQVQKIPTDNVSTGGYFITVYVDNKKAVTKAILKK